jgi:hypothetical protein
MYNSLNVNTKDDLIDNLPYIDEQIDDLTKTQIEHLITKAMDSIDKEKIIQDINSRYKTNTPLNIEMHHDLPFLKPYLPVNTDRNSILLAKELLSIENDNLLLNNKYGITTIDNSINQLKHTLTSIVNENNILKDQITLLNKKRKYNQTTYGTTLTSIQSKINAEKNLISHLEKTLLKK